MSDLNAFPGTTVRIEALPNGRVVATVHWDGVSKANPTWWGSDEMFVLTPDEMAARVAIAPVLATCAQHALPTPKPQLAQGKPALWRRVLASLLDSGPARRYPHE